MKLSYSRGICHWWNFSDSRERKGKHNSLGKKKRWTRRTKRLTGINILKENLREEGVRSGFLLASLLFCSFQYLVTGCISHGSHFAVVYIMCSQFFFFKKNPSIQIFSVWDLHFSHSDILMCEIFFLVGGCVQCSIFATRSWLHEISKATDIFHCLPLCSYPGLLWWSPNQSTNQSKLCLAFKD